MFWDRRSAGHLVHPATVGLASFVVAAMCWAAAAPMARSPGNPQVVLLRNGEVLRGQIDRRGDHYSVIVDGGVITLRARDVEMVCRDLGEACQRKAARIPPHDARQHIELARWCLRHGLVDHARLQLARARALDPDDPAVALVERQLQAPRPAPLPAQGAGQSKRRSDPDDLERFVRQLPPGAVETFTQTIQPILNHHCAAADCHGPQGRGRFRLWRLPVGRPPTRRLTQRNLQATLAWVDQQLPEASPLLSVPIRPHGGAQTPVFPTSQIETYRRLAAWVRQVAQAPGDGTNESAGQVPAALAAGQLATPQELPTQPGGPSVPDGLRTPIPAEAAVATNHRELFRGLGQAPSTPSTSPTGPRDPFDPEIFNRRYFPPDDQTGPDPGRPPTRPVGARPAGGGPAASQ
ncbi:MAG TPA: hypothetical protein EYH34_06770 [Planctomycetes bacterium]|nr:hypothetical protein [Planctomycetota bacterium]